MPAVSAIASAPQWAAITLGSHLSSSRPHLQHVGSHGMSIVKREVKDEVPFLMTAENTEFIIRRK
jgi:hypothetical protein